MSYNKQNMAVSLASYFTGLEKHIHFGNEEYFATFGDKMASSNNNTIITNARSSKVFGWNTAYGSIEIKPRKNKTYFWAIAIVQHHDKYPAVSIGINEVAADHTNTYFHGQATVNYGYKSNGKLYSHIITAGKGFSDPYNSGDIVFMMLKGSALSFSKISLEVVKKQRINTVEDYIELGRWAVAEKNVDSNRSYKMALSLYGKTFLWGEQDKDMGSVQLLQYQLVSAQVDDSEEETDSDTELMEQKQNDEEKNDSFGLKTALICLERRMASFEMAYNQKTLTKEFEKQATSLMVSDDINALKSRLKVFNKHLGKLENGISKFLRPNTTYYEKWNIGQMIQWISCLDNGAYNNYLTVLRKGFISENIYCGKILCDLRKDDLRNSPFNIKDFATRRNLARHFESLKENKHTSEEPSSYNQQSYNPHYYPSAPHNKN